MPYEILIETVGHFKQMKVGAIIEMILNIGVSIILVIKYGLIGVGIGTLCASVFRTLQYTIYFYKNVLKIPIIGILKNYSVSVIEILVVLNVANFFNISNVSFLKLCFDAFILAIIVFIIVGFFSVFFYKTEIMMLTHKFKNFTCFKKGV